MSTRKRNNVPKSDLPPKRKARATAKTTPPFSQISFGSFIYILFALTFAYFAFQVWRLFKLKAEAGGWWNLALGRRLPVKRSDAGPVEGPERGFDSVKESFEGHIEALAQAVGLHQNELASAISEALRTRTTPSSLSSVAAAEATKADHIAEEGTRQRVAENPDAKSGTYDELD